MDRLNLSARAYDRILKVSRTIADLSEGSEQKFFPDILAEAISYRNLDDRENWADNGTKKKQITCIIGYQIHCMHIITRIQERFHARKSI